MTMTASPAYLLEQIASGRTSALGHVERHVRAAVVHTATLAKQLGERLGCPPLEVARLAASESLEAACRRQRGRLPLVAAVGIVRAQLEQAIASKLSLAQLLHRRAMSACDLADRARRSGDAPARASHLEDAARHEREALAQPNTPPDYLEIVRGSLTAIEGELASL